MRLAEMYALNLGLWLSPNGQFIEVATNHIADVINNPAKFGMTSERIESLYAKHGEKLGWEGKAREELITLVLRAGWVRIRNYRNHWSVTVDRLTPDVAKRVRVWVQTFVSRDIMKQYDDVKVYEVARDKLKTHEADDIIKSYSLEEGATMEHQICTESTYDKLPDLQLLTEVKLSRVYDYFTGDRPVGLITAFRGERTLEENTRANKQLAQILRSKGFGYTWVDGAWIENQGTDDEAEVSEVSILVAGDEGSAKLLFETLKDAAVKYNQDAFVYRSGEEGSKILICNKQGNVEHEFTSARLDDIGQIYTKLRQGNHRGRSFVFEGTRDPVGFGGRLAGKVD